MDINIENHSNAISNIRDILKYATLLGGGVKLTADEHDDIKNNLKVLEMSIIDALLPLDKATKEMVERFESKIQQLEESSEVKSAVVAEYQAARQQEAFQLLDALGVNTTFTHYQVPREMCMSEFVRRTVFAMDWAHNQVNEHVDAISVRGNLRQLLIQTWEAASNDTRTQS